MQDSATAFCTWIFTQLCNSTPLNVDTNAVRIKFVQGQPVYCISVLQRLLHQEFTAALAVLERLFAQDNPVPGTTVAWSEAVEAQNLHLGIIYRVVGGEGRGELAVEAVTHRVGGFVVP